MINNWSGNAPSITPRISFRLARESDAPLLHASCYAGSNWERFVLRFRSSLRRQKTGRLHYLVAETGSELIAGGKLISYPKNLEIADLVVAPPWRNQRVGTALIIAMCEAARQMGADNVEIGVLQSNRRAQVLYQRLGFTRSRELKLPGKPPADILSYRIASPIPSW